MQILKIYISCGILIIRDFLRRLLVGITFVSDDVLWRWSLEFTLSSLMRCLFFYYLFQKRYFSVSCFPLSQFGLIENAWCLISVLIFVLPYYQQWLGFWSLFSQMKNSDFAMPYYYFTFNNLCGYVLNTLYSWTRDTQSAIHSILILSYKQLQSSHANIFRKS